MRNFKRMLNDESKKQLSLIAAIIIAVVAALVAILGVATGVIKPFGPSKNNKPNSSVTDSSFSSESSAEPEIEDEEPDVDEEDDYKADDEYYKNLEEQDFFLFNGHGAPYSFKNNKELSVKTSNGGVLKIGKKGATLQGQDRGLILNPRFEGGDPDHYYGVQIFLDADAGGSNFFVLSDPDGKMCRMDTYDKWLGTITADEEGSPVYTSELGTLLFWRTWDQRFAAEYVDDQQFGVALTRDDGNTSSLPDVLIRLYDYNAYEQIGVYRLSTEVNYETGEYQFISLTEANVMGQDTDDAARLLESKIKQSVSNRAISSLMSGDFFASSEKIGEISSDDVDVYTVARPMWCEIANQNGAITPAGQVETEGILVAATIRHTISSIGPITLYFDVTYDYDADENGVVSDIKKLHGTYLGYDWFSEKTWRLFYYRNGFASSEKRELEAQSSRLYFPSVEDEDLQDEASAPLEE